MKIAEYLGEKYWERQDSMKAAANQQHWADLQRSVAALRAVRAQAKLDENDRLTSLEGMLLKNFNGGRDEVTQAATAFRTAVENDLLDAALKERGSYDAFITKVSDRFMLLYHPDNLEAKDATGKQESYINEIRQQVKDTISLSFSENQFRAFKANAEKNKHVHRHGDKKSVLQQLVNNTLGGLWGGLSWCAAQATIVGLSAFRFGAAAYGLNVGSAVFSSMAEATTIPGIATIGGSLACLGVGAYCLYHSNAAQRVSGVLGAAAGIAYGVSQSIGAGVILPVAPQLAMAAGVATLAVGAVEGFKWMYNSRTAKKTQAKEEAYNLSEAEYNRALDAVGDALERAREASIDVMKEDLYDHALNALKPFVGTDKEGAITSFLRRNGHHGSIAQLDKEGLKLAVNAVYGARPDDLQKVQPKFAGQNAQKIEYFLNALDKEVQPKTSPSASSSPSLAPSVLRTVSEYYERSVTKKDVRHDNSHQTILHSLMSIVAQHDQLSGYRKLSASKLQDKVLAEYENHRVEERANANLALSGVSFNTLGDADKKLVLAKAKQDIETEDLTNYASPARLLDKITVFLNRIGGSVLQASYEQEFARDVREIEGSYAYNNTHHGAVSSSSSSRDSKLEVEEERADRSEREESLRHRDMHHDSGSSSSSSHSRPHQRRGSFSEGVYEKSALQRIDRAKKQGDGSPSL